MGYTTPYCTVQDMQDTSSEPNENAPTRKADADKSSVKVSADSIEGEPIEGKLRTQPTENKLRVRPMPASFAAGSRRVLPPRRPSLSPLRAPVPEQATRQVPAAVFSREKLDIKYTTASSFLQFCKGEGAEVLKVTWDELDEAAADTDKCDNF